MFSKKGQVETTVLIFVIFFFILAFDLSLAEIEDKAIKGIDKTSQVIYQDYEKRERRLDRLNFIRMHAYNLSENSELNISEFNTTLANRVDPEVDFGYFNTTNESQDCLIKVVLSDFEFKENSTLRIPECP